MKTCSYLALLSGLIVGFADVSAADAPLTLDEAVDTAIAAAPQLQAQRATVEGVQALVSGAGRFPNPELIAGIDNLPSNGIDAWSVGRDFMTMRKIALTQTFPSGPKRRSEKDTAQAMVALAEAQSAQSQLEVTQIVAQAWVARYAAEVSLKVLQELRRKLLLQVELAHSALANGNASVSDALSAQAAAAGLDDRLLDAQRELAGANAELTRWIGDVADRPLAPPPSFQQLSASDSALLSSLHHHAALQTYDAQIVAAQSEIALAKATKRPDWSAQLAYAERGRGFSDMVSLQVSVMLPLFPGARQDPGIHAKQAALRALEANKESERRMHAAEITTMLSDWHSAKDRIDLYQNERLPLARQRSELALAGLTAGRMELRQSLGILSDQLELEQVYAEQLKSLGRAWAYLHYLPSQGVVP